MISIFILVLRDSERHTFVGGRPAVRWWACTMLFLLLAIGFAKPARADNFQEVQAICRPQDNFFMFRSFAFSPINDPPPKSLDTYSILETLTEWSSHPITCALSSGHTVTVNAIGYHGDLPIECGTENSRIKIEVDDEVFYPLGGDSLYGACNQMDALITMDMSSISFCTFPALSDQNFPNIKDLTKNPDDSGNVINNSTASRMYCQVLDFDR